MMPSLLSLRQLAFLGLVALQHVQASAVEDPLTFFGGTIQTSDDDYWNWYQNVGAKQHGSAAFIASVSDATQGTALHWSIDDNDEENPYLHLAIAVHATGWLGFGLSENGGADMLLFEKRNPTTVLDAYIQSKLKPVLDTCQNWEFVGAVTDSEEYLILQVRRLLDTGDMMHNCPILQDGDLEMPPSLLIAAWGDTEEHLYHGPNNNTCSQVHWDKNVVVDSKADFLKLMDEQANDYFEIRQNKHPIKDQVTEYTSICITWDDLLVLGVPENTFSIIGLLPILDAMEHLHHFAVYGIRDTMNGHPCSNFLVIPADALGGWAHSKPPFELPLDVGIYLGLGSYQSFRLQFHYDNPKCKANVFNSSGMRFYYTKALRPMEFGVLGLGDPKVSLNGTTISPGLSQHLFECPSMCSQTTMTEPVTVMREYLHMHAIGKSMKNEMIRDEQVIHTA